MDTPPPIVPGQPEPPRHAPLQAPGDSTTVRKAAVGTVTVIVTLVAVFCGLPLLICGGMALLGAALPTPSP